MTHPTPYLDRFYLSVAALIALTIVNFVLSLAAWRRHREPPKPPPDRNL
jgi:hypothetical protein